MIGSPWPRPAPAVGSRPVPHRSAPVPRLLAVGGAVLASVLAVAGCAPRPTALEKYCDVVHQAEATFDPLSRPGSLGDPDLLRRALTARVTTLTALTQTAPDAVRPDATVVQARVTAVLNAMAAKNYVAASADGDPVIAEVLADPSYLDAAKRLAAFNGTRCAAASKT
jgi:hypothetical protein